MYDDRGNTLSVGNFLCCSLEGVAFFSNYVSLPFPFGIESTLYVFLPCGMFLPCDHGVDFDISANVRIQSTNH